ncbi:MAG: radical SAM protein [Thermoplasmata archaeon]
MSEDCNMRCSYCYTTHGTFKREVKSKTANWIRILDTVFGRFEIKGIAFFGGEPLLNIPLIETICEYARDIGFKGNFSLATNGLELRKKNTIEIVKRYNIHLTVSMDGPEEAHDLCSGDINGKPTYAKVIEGINSLKSHNIPFGLQATYTKEHFDNGYGLWDIATHLVNLSPIAYYFKPAVSCPLLGCICDTHSILKANLDLSEIYGNYTKMVMQTLLTPKPYYDMGILAVILRLFKREVPDYVCQQHNTLTVFGNGDIYPCHMLTHEKFRIGNIYTSNPFEQYEKVTQHLKNLTDARKLISRYWTASLQEICPGAVLQHPEQEELYIEEKLFRAQEAMWENVIGSIVEFWEDKTKWNKFIENLDKIFTPRCYE